MHNRISKLKEKVLASLLILLLLSSDFSIIGNSIVSYASAEAEDKDEITNHKNVEFNAYFQDEGVKSRSSICNVDQEMKLNIHLNVKDAGYLRNASIRVKDANYLISNDINEEGVIGRVQEDGFELKQIMFGTDIYLDIPITIKNVEEKFELSNIDKNSKIVLDGIYVDEEGKENSIYKEVELNLTWKSEPKVKAESEVVLYKSYEEEEKNITLVGEKISIEKEAGKLPVKETKISIDTNIIANKVPEDVKVIALNTEMTNGKKDVETECNANYNKETNKLEIITSNQEKDGFVNMSTSGKDEYLIIYEYITEEKLEEVNVSNNYSVIVENYDGAITEETIQDPITLNETKGDIIGGDIIAQESVNKAKIYANYLSEDNNYETEYTVKQILEVLNADRADSVKIVSEESFINEIENKSSIENATYYKSTRISKDNFIEILGEDGYISISNEEGEIVKIDSSFEDENGIYVVNYENEKNIIIETSKPIKEGLLAIEHIKAIGKVSEFSKEEMTEFKKLENTTAFGDSRISKNTELFEEEKLVSISSSIDVVDKARENIELKVLLGNDSINSKLYENPTLRITLPEFIESVEIENSNILFDNELSLGEVIVENGNNIVVPLIGKQTKFNTVEGGTAILIDIKVNCKQEENEGSISLELDGAKAETKLTSYFVQEEIITEDVIPQSEEKTEFFEVEENVEALITTENVEEKEQLQANNMQVNNEQEIEPRELVANVGSGNNIVAEEVEELEVRRLKQQLGRLANVFVRIYVDENDAIVREGNTLYYYIDAWRLPNSDSVENATIKNVVPLGYTFIKAEHTIYNSNETKDGTVSYNEQTRELIWQTGNLDVAQLLKVQVKAEEINTNEAERVINNSAQITLNGVGEIVTTGDLETRISKQKLETVARSENLNETNKLGDEINFILSTQNMGIENEDLTIRMSIPEELSVTEYAYGENNNLITANGTGNNIEISGRKINAGKTYLLNVSTRVTNVNETKKIVVLADVNGKEVSWEVNLEKTNIPYNVDIVPHFNDGPTEMDHHTYIDPDNIPDGGNNDGGNTPPNKNPNGEIPDSVDKTIPHSISGMAWLDENENGIKEIQEKMLSNIKVRLIRTSDKSTVQETTTDSSGRYQFSDVYAGNYQVVFEYDSKNYRVVAYQKNRTPEINSSAISSKQSNEAYTDIITITDKNVQYMNIGLIKILEFDMSLKKEISRIIVQSSNGTKTYNYNDSFAKLDINAKYINGAVVLIEYKIKVTNEGEIGGTVKEIVDYIPNDMQFSTELNSSWVQDSDGNLYNRELKNLTINPGETKEITLVLRKKMSNSNTGLVHNVAELSQVENSKNLPDGDSVPKNRMQGEDDMASADVLIGVQTGKEVAYVTLAIVVLIMLATGIYIINKRVLKV